MADEKKPKPHKEKVLCVCCDFTCELEAMSPEHIPEGGHRCPECGCILVLATWTTEHWHV